MTRWLLLLLMLPLAACSDPAPDRPPQPLAATSWSVVAIDGRVMPPGPAPALRLGTGRSPNRGAPGALSFAGWAGCNGIGGAYWATADSLRFGEVEQELQLCDPALTEREGALTAALGAARTYRQQADTLWVLDGGGRSRLVLVRLWTPAPGGPGPPSARTSRQSEGSP